MTTRPFDVVRPTVTEPVPRPKEPVRLELEKAPSETHPYVLSPDLATAVNVALALDQPLLVTGEPGCGKTTLAWAIADQLATNVLDFHTKSTSVARDLFYAFDSVRRFHDASVGQDDARDASRYVAYQALGEAFRSDRTHVVLVDEIDKAPRDFPNDLLHELDRKEFVVAEVSPPLRFEQKVQQFILVTSNSERRLPLPFLRRCVYAHLEFPDATMLGRIVELHTGRLGVSPSFVTLAVQRFVELRAVPGLGKKPATSELVGWVKVLHRLGVDEAALEKVPLGKLPAVEVLVKLLEDRTVLTQSRTSR